MINNNIMTYPCIATREFVYFGLHRRGDIVKYNFTSAHKALMDSGALIDFPEYFYEYRVSNLNGLTLNNTRIEKDTIIDICNLSKQAIHVFIKQGIISKNLKQDLNIDMEEILSGKVTEEIKEEVNVVQDELIGKKFKTICLKHNKDFKEMCTNLGLGQGAHNKKIKLTDIDRVKLFIGE